jgi:O-antigen ligase
VYIATAATAAGMGLLTSSRSVAVTLTIPAIPVLVYLTKRPVLILVVASVVVVGILFTIDQVTDKNFSRLATLETDRFAVFREYLAIVAKRPWFGLLGTKNESYLAASSVGRHSHNAYIEALYVGGVSYAVPMFMLAAYSFVCCVRCWRKRGLTPYDPLAISVLSSFLIMMYVHGFVNDAIYYPTYFWAFLHVTLASFFVCAAKKVREIESCYRLSIGQS